MVSSRIEGNPDFLTPLNGLLDNLDYKSIFSLICAAFELSIQLSEGKAFRVNKYSLSAYFLRLLLTVCALLIFLYIIYYVNASGLSAASCSRYNNPSAMLDRIKKLSCLAF